MSCNVLTHNDYTVGWICALEVELAAAQAMLDEEHQNLPRVEQDTNTYTLGLIGQHNVVLACLPSGIPGTNAAATVATNLLRTFPRIRFNLLVGIEGGAPSSPDTDPRNDIRLGDVVVSNPGDAHGKLVPIWLSCSKSHIFTGGVMQYDFGKTIKDKKFICTGSSNKPPTTIGTAVTRLRARARQKAI